MPDDVGAVPTERWTLTPEDLGLADDGRIFPAVHRLQDSQVVASTLGFERMLVGHTSSNNLVLGINFLLTEVD